MSHKPIVAILIGLCVTHVMHVKSMCIILLAQYYKCKYPNTLLTEAFLKNELKDITTFNGAMEKYKSIYTELDWNTCSSWLCTCVKNQPKLTKWKYDAFFLNLPYYWDLVSIQAAVNNKYTPLDRLNDPPFANNKFIHDFCNKFDFSIYDHQRYNESNRCKDLSKIGSKTCHKYLTNMTSTIHLKNDLNKFENFLRCTASFLSSCDLEMKRAFLVFFLSASPDVVKNGLLTYVNWLISSAEADLNRLAVVWATGNLHISSVMKGLETCILNTTLACVQSKNVIIYCTGSELSNGFTYLSEIRIIFSNQNEQCEFTADETSLPSTLSNGQTKLRDVNGDDWLKLSAFNAENVIVITDFSSKMVISIGKSYDEYFLVVQGPKSTFRLGGLLYYGCVPENLRSRKTVPVNDSSNAASVCSINTLQNESSLISSSDLYAACVNDVLVEQSDAVVKIYKTTLDAYYEVKNAYSESLKITEIFFNIDADDTSTKLHSISSHLLLALGFFLNIIF